MKILFVCTGNTCRSPMAEQILRKWRPDLEVSSAGLHAHDSQPLTPEAKQVLKQSGLFTNHHSKQLTNKAVLAADEILVMTKVQFVELQSIFPNAVSKLDLVSLSGKEIVDPYGQAQASYEKTFKILKAAIYERFLTK